MLEIPFKNALKKYSKAGSVVRQRYATEPEGIKYLTMRNGDVSRIFPFLLSFLSLPHRSESFLTFVSIWKL